MKRGGGMVGSGASGSVRLEDALYAVAKREIESGTVRPEAWQMAQRLSRGDDRRAVSAYIRIRVRTLLEAHEARKR